MTEKSYQDAVKLLRDHIGTQWEGDKTEGRDEMVKVLRAELGYDRQAAHDAIDAMIKTGQLRYHPSTARSDVADGDVLNAPVEAVGSASSGAVVPALGEMLGYWQIGREDSGSVAGRTGQVTPH
jgi:hypothetical protein